MKLNNKIAAVIFFIVVLICCKPTNYNKSDFLEGYFKVWGLLKYYTPGISKNDINWDSVFISDINKVKKFKTTVEYHALLSNLIVLGGSNKNLDHNNISNNKEYKITFDTGWINNKSIYSGKIITSLRSVILNKAFFKNKYIKVNKDPGNPVFSIEKAFLDSVFPSESLRLLALSRYWNIINFFYPYKHLIDSNWDKVLHDYISRVRFAQDTLEYHLAILELSTLINDNHSYTYSEEINNYLGYYNVPVLFRYVENKVIVNDYYSDSLAILNNLLIGDIVQKIENVPIDKILLNKGRYISGANEISFYRNLLVDLLSVSKKDSVFLQINRNGKIIDVISNRYHLNDLYNAYESNQTNKSCTKFFNGDSVCYINMGAVSKDQVDSIMKLCLHKKGIIFDLRNYPQGTGYLVSNYLNPLKVEFAQWFAVDTNFPGNFYFNLIYTTGPDRFNNNYYKGSVVLLVDEYTQSHAEFTAMILQTAPNVVTIGSQTAGSDGDISFVDLPGGIVTCFSGAGVQYPDGTQAQRTGIKIDIIVKPTIESIRSNTDKPLNRALQYINGK